jgi:hypothetical protein
MAGHGMSEVTAAILRDRMESRFGYLHYNDQYNGRHADEYGLLEELLADEIIEDDGSSFCVMEDAGQLDRNSAPVITAHSFREDSVGVGGVSRPVGGSLPPLLTGGGPCTVSDDSPMFHSAEVQEFSHGGFDGGIEVGFDGTWNTLKFSDLLEVLEGAKSQASENHDDVRTCDRRLL